MMKRRKRQRDRACLAKRLFRGRDAAVAAIDDYERRVVVRGEGRMSVYLCEYGDHWHIGHTTPQTMRIVLVREFMKSVELQTA